MKGSATPLVGIRLIMTAMFMIALVITQRVTPAASSDPNGSCARRAICRPRTTNSTNSAITKAAPRKPSSSPITAKILSVCGVGRKPNFCKPCPSPTPVQPPFRNAIIA